MGTRRELFERVNAAKTMVIPQSTDNDNSVDNIINELEAVKEEPKKAVSKSAKSVPGPKKEILMESVTVKGITLELKAKEQKSVRKSFAISDKLNRKFVSLAKENGVSENELLNKILEQILD